MLTQDWVVFAAIMAVAVLGCAVYLLARVVRQEGDLERGFERGDDGRRRPVAVVGPSPEGYALNLNPFAGSGPVQPVRLSRPDGISESVVADTTGVPLRRSGSEPAALPESRYAARDSCPPPCGCADTPDYEFMVIHEIGE